MYSIGKLIFKIQFLSYGHEPDRRWIEHDQAKYDNERPQNDNRGGGPGGGGGSWVVGVIIIVILYIMFS